MKFDTIYDFFKYLTDNNIDLCKMDIELTPIDGVSSRLREVPEKEKQEESIKDNCSIINENIKIFLEDLSGSPDIKFETSEENVIYVEDYSMRPFSCGTISMKLLGRDLLLNACQESEDVIKTKLNIKINENIIKNVDFLIKKDVQLVNTILIKETLINDNSGSNS